MSNENRNFRFLQSSYFDRTELWYLPSFNEIWFEFAPENLWLQVTNMRRRRHVYGYIIGWGKSIIVNIINLVQIEYLWVGPVTELTSRQYGNSTMKSFVMPNFLAQNVCVHKLASIHHVIRPCAKRCNGYLASKRSLCLTPNFWQGLIESIRDFQNLTQQLHGRGWGRFCQPFSCFMYKERVFFSWFDAKYFGVGPS